VLIKYLEILKLPRLEVVSNKENVMNSKLTGSLLFGVAGLVAAIGAAGAQIAYDIVLGGFYAGNMTGVNPP
jgi:hypothetical protein